MDLEIDENQHCHIGLEKLMDHSMISRHYCGTNRNQANLKRWMVHNSRNSESRATFIEDFPQNTYVHRHNFREEIPANNPLQRPVSENPGPPHTHKSHIKRCEKPHDGGAPCMDNLQHTAWTTNVKASQYLYRLMENMSISIRHTNVAAERIEAHKTNQS